MQFLDVFYTDSQKHFKKERQKLTTERESSAPEWGRNTHWVIGLNLGPPQFS